MQGQVVFEEDQCYCQGYQWEQQGVEYFVWIELVEQWVGDDFGQQQEKNGWQVQVLGQLLIEQGGGIDVVEGEQDSVLVYRGFFVSVVLFVLSWGELLSYMVLFFFVGMGSWLIFC